MPEAVELQSTLDELLGEVNNEFKVYIENCVNEQDVLVGIEESYYEEVAKILQTQIDLISRLYTGFTETFPQINNE